MPTVDPLILTYFRGDSYPIIFSLTNKTTKLPLDLTGCSLNFTVASDKNPIDDTNKVFSVVGVLDADPETGKVSFTPTIENTSIEAKKYFYDIQLLDVNSNIRTIVKNEFNLVQDITK